MAWKRESHSFLIEAFFKAKERKMCIVVGREELTTWRGLWEWGPWVDAAGESFLLSFLF